MNSYTTYARNKIYIYIDANVVNYEGFFSGGVKIKNTSKKVLV